MILFFDTETTGLTPGQICQLSYVQKSGSKVERKNFYFAVESIPAEVSAITKLTVPLLKELSSGKVFRDHAREIIEDFASANLVVAHNFAFDYAFMQEECSRLGTLFCYKDKLCTMQYFNRILKLPRKTGGYKYPKLVELCAAYDISESQILQYASANGFHDARFDAEAVFLICSKACQSIPHLANLMEANA